MIWLLPLLWSHSTVNACRTAADCSPNEFCNQIGLNNFVCKDKSYINLPSSHPATGDPREITPNPSTVGTSCNACAYFQTCYNGFCQDTWAYGGQFPGEEMVNSTLNTVKWVIISIVLICVIVSVISCVVCYQVQQKRKVPQIHFSPTEPFRIGNSPTTVPPTNQASLNPSTVGQQSTVSHANSVSSYQTAPLPANAHQLIYDSNDVIEIPNPPPQYSPSDYRPGDSKYEP